jgi:hypothetical protein
MDYLIVESGIRDVSLAHRSARAENVEPNGDRNSFRMDILNRHGRLLHEGSIGGDELRAGLFGTTLSGCESNSRRSDNQKHRELHVDRDSVCNGPAREESRASKLAG